jgi:hypothetical protein
MQVIRTIVWVFFAVVLVAFIAINWNPVRVNFWPLSDGYLHFDWPVGFIVLFSFVLGQPADRQPREHREGQHRHPAARHFDPARGGCADAQP